MSTQQHDVTWLDESTGLLIEASDDGTRLRLVIVRAGAAEVEPIGELSADSAIELALLLLVAARVLDEGRATELLRMHGLLLDGVTAH